MNISERQSTNNTINPEAMSKENRLAHPEWFKRRNAISGPSGCSGYALDPVGNGTSGSREDLPKNKDDKRADERNKSNSAVSAVTARLEKLEMPGSDKAKSTQGGEARKD